MALDRGIQLKVAKEFLVTGEKGAEKYFLPKKLYGSWKGLFYSI